MKIGGFMLRLAVQSKGRLSEESIQLLREAGITIEDSRSKLLARSEDFPVEILYLRDDDIPHAVAMGVADLGVVGLNEVEEKRQQVEVLRKLGFGKCHLSLAIPNSEEYVSSVWFNGKKIATSYPRILTDYFELRGIKADIHEISGSVEIAPSVGMSDAIFDIVSSGGTLLSNGLKEVEKVFFSETVIIANPKSAKEKQEIISQLLFRIESVESSRGKKYVMLNVPREKVDEVTRLIPGMKSPTILPLAQEGWCSIHAVISEKELWTKIEQLKKLGAEDILVLALEKMIV